MEFVIGHGGQKWSKWIWIKTYAAIVWPKMENTWVCLKIGYTAKWQVSRESADQLMGLLGYSNRFHTNLSMGVRERFCAWHLLTFLWYLDPNQKGLGIKGTLDNFQKWFFRAWWMAQVSNHSWTYPSQISMFQRDSMEPQAMQRHKKNQGLCCLQEHITGTRNILKYKEKYWNIVIHRFIKKSYQPRHITVFLFQPEEPRASWSANKLRPKAVGIPPAKDMKPGFTSLVQVSPQLSRTNLLIHQLHFQYYSYPVEPPSSPLPEAPNSPRSWKKELQTL